jgi:hypothetical protein
VLWKLSWQVQCHLFPREFTGRSNFLNFDVYESHLTPCIIVNNTLVSFYYKAWLSYCVSSQETMYFWTLLRFPFNQNSWSHIISWNLSFLPNIYLPIMTIRGMLFILHFTKFGQLVYVILMFVLNWGTDKHISWTEIREVLVLLEP